MKIIKSTFLVLFFITTINGFSQVKKVTYPDVKNRITLTRESFLNKYNSSDSIQKLELINSARQFVLNTIIDSLFPFWYGTQWDFNGQTREPGVGAIACGYFVTEILSDAGFNIPRVYWAQQASEVIIKIMSRDIVRFSNRPIQEVVSKIKSKEDGLYVVGLDSHVGFIYKRGDKIQFVHANYYYPSIGVMSEEPDSGNPLRDSKYRVLGKILDDKMILCWIKGERIE